MNSLRLDYCIEVDLSEIKNWAEREMKKGSKTASLEIDYYYDDIDGIILRPN